MRKQIGERAKIKLLLHELEAAGQMAKQLLPPSPQSASGLEFAGACRQALFIGGDSFDFIRLPQRQAAFIICDVSGKGITAALIWAALRAAIRRETSRLSSNLAGLMSHLDQLSRDSSPYSRYITLFYAQYDPQSSRLHYVNAGHPAPFLIRANPILRKPIRLDAGGPPVGLPLPNPSYEQGEVILQPGDVIVACTDGVAEPMGSGDIVRGMESLASATASLPGGLASQEILGRLFGAADAARANFDPGDDMTMIVIKAIEETREAQSGRRHF